MPTPDLGGDPAVRYAVATAWAAAALVTHTPQDDTYGVTCDERGCVLCNGGPDAIPYLAADYADHRWDPDEAADALDELAAWLRGHAG